MSALAEVQRSRRFRPSRCKSKAAELFWLSWILFDCRTMNAKNKKEGDRHPHIDSLRRLRAKGLRDIG